MHRLFGLNSLTDIVSNAIGIAILLALVTFLSSVSRTYEVVVPLAQESSLTPRFFVCRNDALLPVDRGAILRQLADHAARSPEGDEAVDLTLDGDVRASAELTGAAGFLLRTPSTRGWIPRSALSSGADPFARIDPARELAYFFVYDEPRGHRASGSGFDVLRQARTMLVERGVRVGWTVVTSDHPPHICASISDPACRYGPSMP